ncbi:hypothetical protein WQ53_15380 [Pseudoxanthomonas suwonensis]|uniref:DUF4440 domain-containing protein n=2 Tax=Pseudoxanthomonas suwonensis TaxID=314722 RepID=A0A0E3UPL6_9GAMM|nr:hypothetical protein WQ53_15380 [Pseudoxanthomonas suwonensis]
MLLAVSILLLACACRAQAPADAAPAAGPAAEAAPAGVPADAVAAPADTATPPATTPAQAEATAPAAAANPAAEAATDAAGEQAVNHAIDATLGDHTRYKPVIQALQSAVAAGDAAQVAALARYPFNVTINGRPTVLHDEKAFIARYPEFMTPEIRDAIVGTKYGDLFVNYQGVMFGRGQAWINGLCHDDKCKEFEVKLVTLQPFSG